MQASKQAHWKLPGAWSPHLLTLFMWGQVHFVDQHGPEEQSQFPIATALGTSQLNIPE